MTANNTIRLGRPVRLAAAGLLLAACSSGGGATWTYAPLGPTADPSAAPTGGPSAAPSPGQSPGLAIEVSTPQEDQLAFVPAELEMPASTSVTVTYLNDSAIPHNINFFAGPDNTAESLGATVVVTGPDAPESVTFETPAEPGDYYFWCDVHLQAMDGTWTVTP